MKRTTRLPGQLFVLGALAIALAACTEQTLEGGVEPNWENPIEGEVADSVQAADSAVPFKVYEPKNLGTPSKILVSKEEVPEKDRQVDFLFDTQQYGLVSVGEGPALPPASEWEEFIKSAVADSETSHGSAEIVTLDNGARALVTTTEDKERSDICWLDSSGTIEFCVLGPRLTRDDAVKIANSI